MKKIISALTALAVIICSFSLKITASVNASANIFTEIFTENGITYQFEFTLFDDGSSIDFSELSVIECELSGDVVIPESVRGFPVSRIADAFNGNAGLTSVSIPQTVKDISRSFCGCASLAEVVIPSGVKSMYIKASFRDCVSLEEIVIPSGVKSITDNLEHTASNELDVPFSFDGCVNLKSVSLPDTLLYLVGFNGCSSLASLTVPTSVRSLSGFNGCSSLASLTILTSVLKRLYGFDNCSSLTSLTIPKSVNDLSGFRGCENLAEIIFPDDWEPDYYDSHSVYTSFEGSLWYASQPDGAVYIGPFVRYKGKRNLDYPADILEIADGTISIDINAFKGCNFKEIRLPDSVKTIQANAFENCAFLEKINIPEGVITIGYKAFFNCPNLKTITIPESVWEIGANAIGIMTHGDILHKKANPIVNYYTSEPIIYGYDFSAQRQPWNRNAEEYAAEYEFEYVSLGIYVSAAKFVTLTKAYFGLETISANDLRRYDMDRNGVLDITDIALMKRRLIYG